MVELSKKGVEADLPQGAHSVFRFDIKETSDDLLKEMETPSKKHYPDRRIIDRDGVQFEKGAPKAKWETQYADDGSMFLVDLDFDCEAEVKKRMKALILQQPGVVINIILRIKVTGREQKLSFTGR